MPKNTGTRSEVGVAFVDPETGALVPHPMPFAERNSVELGELQAVLTDLVRPDRVRTPMQLSPSARAALRHELECVVDEPPKPDAPPDRVRFKPLLTGVRRAVAHPEKVHVASKAGRAYGFLVDNAYFRYQTREVSIAAAIYVNANGVVGDDEYEYDRIGLPFFEALGEMLAGEVLAGEEFSDDDREAAMR